MPNILNLQVIGTGRPLVLLHGWGSHSSIWQPLAAQLTEEFQLFLPDLPGFGKSPLMTVDYNIEEVASALLEITPPDAIWLGWSLGGMIAWYIALHHPERVSKLITIASSPKFIAGDNWPGVSFETLERFSQLLIQDYKKTWQDFMELQLRGAPKNQALDHLLQIQLDDENHNPVAALSSSLQLLHTLDLRQDLHKIQCPALHVFGQNDTLVPIDVTEKIQSLTENATCRVIKRAGHIPFLSQQDIFLNEVNTFLQK